MEVAVHRLCQAVADARDGAEQVGARPQVRDFAQELQRVRLGLDRVGFRILDPADDLDVLRLDLETSVPGPARAPACRWRSPRSRR